ncbi:MAG: hypothetical protein JRK53_10290 [Deltaproteobacteria bacterium]|nr:hypothetical protein [Deltaproteobacteria bacterium]MBW1816033.1 hypothetical protein [Deltaproteobacteria bacterium]MBW2283387.1 hypothetical protein [Deltaproteobacteria bacterium]
MPTDAQNRHAARPLDRNACAALDAAFDRQGERRAGLPEEAWYTIARGKTLVRTPGRQLAQALDAPLTHLRDGKKGDVEVRLKVSVMDRRRPADPEIFNTLASQMDAEEPARASEDGRFIAHRTPHTLTCFDRKRRHILAWISDADELLIYERSRPFYFPLLLWCHDRDMEVVHAGLVSRQGRGVLLAGMGGAGKSTVALACLCRGWTFLSDDYVAVEKAPGGSFIGHSLYSSSHLAPDHLPRFPHLAKHALRGHTPKEDKCLIYLGRIFPDLLARSVPIRAIALPTVKEMEGARICSVSKAEAFLALAPSSMAMLPLPAKKKMDRMAALVERVPCFRLEMGPDLDAIPSAVNKIIEASERAWRHPS